MHQKRLSRLHIKRAVTICLAFLFIISLHVFSDFDTNIYSHKPSLSAKRSEFAPKQFLIRDVLETRTTLNGEKLSNRFCAMDEGDKCHWDLYMSYLISIGGPGIALAALSVVACPIFWCLRLCCNLWGGRKPTPGIFCPGKRENFKGYTAKHIWGIKIALWAACLGIGVCVIVGFVGNKKVGNGIRGLGDTLIDTGNIIVDKHIGNILLELEYTKDSGQSVLDVKNQAKKLVDQAEDVNTQVHDIDKYRSAALLASLIFPLLLATCGSVGAAVTFKWLSMLAAIWIFTASAIIWLSSGLHIIVNTLVGDICLEVDDFLKDDSASNPVLDLLLECKDGAAFTEIRNVAQDGLNEAWTVGCDSLDELCSDPIANCTAQGCSRDTIETYKQVVIQDYELGCDDAGLVCPWSGACSNPVPCNVHDVTIEYCATECTNSELRSASNDTVTAIDLMVKYDDLINNEILPLLDCEFIIDAMYDLEGFICGDLKKGLSNIAGASVALAVFLVPATFLLVMGFKRFRRAIEIRDSSLSNQAAEMAQMTPPQSAQPQSQKPPEVPPE